MELTLIVSTSVYCCAVLLVLLVLLKKQKSNSLVKIPFISVIIAARNEEHRVVSTLQSLSEIEYRKEKYEVIFVDDASQDNTANVIESFVNNNANWNLIRIAKKDDKLKGKKAALKQAITKAQGEIILTTDADCSVPKEWLSEMAACFNDSISMVLGHALLVKQKGWINKLLRFDNLFSAIMTAAPTLLGFAMTSVGRNMAYKKDSYLKSGGYDELSSHKSGDDVHLTELFRRNVSGKIVFCLAKNSFTYSSPPDSFTEIFHQQLRKNSKILKKSFSTLILSFFLFGYHVLLIGFPFLHASNINVWLTVLASKLVFEFLTLAVASKKFSDPSIIPLIPFMQIFYPVYVSVMGVIAMFQKYEWKK